MGARLDRFLDALEYRRHQKRENKLRKAEMKALRKKYKKEKREFFRQSVKSKLSGPFTDRKLSADEVEVMVLKSKWKQERREEKKRWLASFRRNPYRTLFPKNEALEESRRIVRQSKIDRKAVSKQERRENLGNLVHLFSTNEARTRVLNIYLLSTAYYLAAFLLILVVYHLATSLVAARFHIPVEWKYYRVQFLISTDSPLYTRSALVFIFGSGPLSSLLLTFLFLRLFYSTHPVLRNMQLFSLWGVICGLNMFFGSYIVGTITRTDFIYSTEWLLMNTPFDFREMLMAMLSIFVLILAGWQLTPMFLVASGSLTMVAPGFRLSLILFQVILPWITGVILFFLINSPMHYLPFFFKTLTPGLMLLPSLFTYNSVRNNTILEMEMIRRLYFRWSIIIAIIIVIILYRAILNFGIRVS